MYLASIQIRNFQSLRDLDLHFSAEPTVLVGETNVGKSAVIRALRTVLSIPRGSSFITDGEQTCTIKLLLVGPDGAYDITYEKKRGGGTKLGLLTPTKTNEWQAVTSLPDEIRALGLSGLVLDDTTTVSVNIAGQLDDVFLLKGSQAVTAAKVLARISTVDRIHQGLKAVATDTTRLKTEQTAVMKSLAAAEQQVRKYSRLPELSEDLSDLSLIRGAAEELSQKIDKMSIPRLNTAVGVWSAIEKFNPALQQEGLASIAAKALAGFSFVEKLQRGVVKIVALQGVKEKLLGLEQPPSVEQISQSISLLKEAREKKSKMARLMQEVFMELALQIEASEESLRVKKKEMEEKFPACPTCHRPWENAHV